MAPGWQCFQLELKNRTENMANLAPCPGSDLTWVHQLWLSGNLVCMGNHYDYEVLMVEVLYNLNSIEPDIRGRCLTRTDLIKRYMESRVLELLGKMDIGPFAFRL